MNRILIVSVIAFALTLPFKAHSKTLYHIQSAEPNESPERLIENGMKMILDALELFIQNMPQYEAPEILDNGDIIIRRVRPNENNAPVENSKPSKQM